MTSIASPPGNRWFAERNRRRITLALPRNGVANGGAADLRRITLAPTADYAGGRDKILRRQPLVYRIYAGAGRC
jgi:hypothetical protein